MSGPSGAVLSWLLGVSPVGRMLVDWAMYNNYPMSKKEFVFYCTLHGLYIYGLWEKMAHKWFPKLLCPHEVGTVLPMIGEVGQDPVCPGI